MPAVVLHIPQAAAMPGIHAFEGPLADWLRLLLGRDAGLWNGAEGEQERRLLGERVRTVTGGQKELEKVPGDGNCLVRAFLKSARLLDTHEAARVNAAQWLAEHPNVVVKVC
jgi:hypothetical protein